MCPFDLLCNDLLVNQFLLSFLLNFYRDLFTLFMYRMILNTLVVFVIIVLLNTTIFWRKFFLLEFVSLTRVCQIVILSYLLIFLFNSGFNLLPLLFLVLSLLSLSLIFLVVLTRKFSTLKFWEVFWFLLSIRSLCSVYFFLWKRERCVFCIRY